MKDVLVALLAFFCIASGLTITGPKIKSGEGGYLHGGPFDLTQFGGPPSTRGREEWYSVPWNHSLSHEHPPGAADLLKLRFIIDQQFVQDHSTAPIIFYAGNEANVELFYNTSGFHSHTLAKELGAFVVYAEHRFFGKSRPPYLSIVEAFSAPYNRFLTVENAMMDYVALVAHLREKYEAGGPVFTFGGSYGGMLAGWLRMKFPSVVQGAVVSGGPILYFKGTDLGLNTFYHWIKIIYDREGVQGDLPPCGEAIKSSMAELVTFFDKPNEWKDLSSIFSSSCHNSSSPNYLGKVYSDLVSSIYNLPSKNYNRASNMMTIQPPKPLPKVCPAFQQAKTPSDMFKALNFLLNQYTNYTGSRNCERPDPIKEEFEAVSAKGWQTLACGSLVMPIADGYGSLFPHPPGARLFEYDYEAKKKKCESLGLTPNFDFQAEEFGVTKDQLKSYSNIIFANAGLDPWLSGSVQEQLSEKLPVLLSKNSSHHEELFIPSEKDSESLNHTRAEILRHLKLWTEEAAAARQHEKEALTEGQGSSAGVVQKFKEFPYNRKDKTQALSENMSAAAHSSSARSTTVEKEKASDAFVQRMAAMNR